MSTDIKIKDIIVEEPHAYKITPIVNYEVNPCIESITNNTVNAYSNANTSSVGFKIDAMGSNMIIKPEITFKFSLRLLAKFKDNRTSGWTTPFTNDNNNSFALSQFSLYRICSNLNINFNNTMYSLNNLDRMINALSFYDSLEHLSGNSVQPDNAVTNNFSELSKTVNADSKNAINPFLPYGYSNKFISRRSYIVVDSEFDGDINGVTFAKGYKAATAKGEFAYQLLTVKDLELRLPLELFHNYDNGLVNITSLQFDFSFNSQYSKLVSYNSSGVTTIKTTDGTEVPGLDFDSISYFDWGEDVPKMNYYRVAMDPKLQKSLTVNGQMVPVPYKIAKYNVISTQDVNVAANSLGTSFNFNSNTYTYIPKKIFVYFLKNYQSTKNADYSTTPANFGKITSFELRINNQVLNYTNKEISQMFNLATANGLNNDYCSLYQWKNGLVGSVIAIDVSNDIGVPGCYTGMPQTVQIDCKCTVQNDTDTDVIMTGNMVIVNEAILVLAPTNAVIKDALDDNQALVKAIDDDYSTILTNANRRVKMLGGRIIGAAMHGARHAALHGAGFWDSFKNFIGKAARVISKIATPIASIFAPELLPIASAGSAFSGSIADHLGAGLKSGFKSTKNRFKGV